MTPFGVQNPCLLASAIAFDTGKILKKLLGVFDRGEDYLQNGIQNFDYLSVQSSDIAGQSRAFYTLKSWDFYL